MKSLLLKISLLGITIGGAFNSSQIISKYSNCTNSKNINYNDKTNNQAAVLNKVKLPLLGEASILADCSYQVHDNAFISLIKTKNSNLPITLYYIDTTDINNIVIKNLGIVPDIANGFYFTSVHLAENKIILYRKADGSYTYIDISDLAKPIIKTFKGPIVTETHHSIIHQITAINENSVIIACLDGTFYINFSDINNPITHLWDFQSNGVLKISNDNFIITSVHSHPGGGIYPALYILNIKDYLNPILTEINVDLLSYYNLELIQVLSSTTFIVKINNTNLYYLNIENVINPILIDLAIVGEANYLLVQVINSTNFVVGYNDKETNKVILVNVDVSNWQNILKTVILLPELTDISFIFDLLYVSDNKIIIRIVHDSNNIVTYLLDITDINKPLWTDSGFAADHNLWKPIKLANNAVLFNDKSLNAWYVYF